MQGMRKNSVQRAVMWYNITKKGEEEGRERDGGEEGGETNLSLH